MTMNTEVIVVGGSFAGISAALPLARARRRVTVVDAGLRRNRFAAHSHGLLGQDKRAPGDIIADARAQLLAYPTVRWVEGTIDSAGGGIDDFAVTLADGAQIAGRRVVLATGVVDELPAIEGLTERWGKSVFMCPYCDGYELNQGRIGVLASSETALHQAMMLPDWGSVTLFLNGAFVPNADQGAELARRGVRVVAGAVVAVSGARADVELDDGQVIGVDGLFVAPHTRPASPVAAQLGCAFETGPMGQFVATDGMKQTSVDGVFACGDVARGAGSVPLAVGDGAMAGVATHRSLLFG